MVKIDKVFIKNDNNTQTINAEADLTGFFNGGFTLDWTTNDAVATQMLYLALGQGSEAKVLTGSYRGDGAASHFITVGFVPDFVIVKGGDQTGVERGGGCVSLQHDERRQLQASRRRAGADRQHDRLDRHDWW